MNDDAKDFGTQIVNSELKAYDQTPDKETWIYKFAAKPVEPKPDPDKSADRAEK